MNLYNGDCLEELKKIGDNSIDSIVTDPPYGLAFMGKKWDYDVPSIEIWKECLRVLKPGGHLLSFGGTRTYHRMVVAIEDAGFEIRDQIQWLYGSGFPKSMDISKAIDKQAGAERSLTRPGIVKRDGFGDDWDTGSSESRPRFDSPVTEAAEKWQGWGTALKPANEPICLARKPISEKTVAQNVLKHGTGAMNIDECRIGSEERTYKGMSANKPDVGTFRDDDWEPRDISVTVSGRWPANVIFDEEAGKVLDEQSGVSKSVVRPPNDKSATGNGNTHGKMEGIATERGFADSGGASRFFYCAKASKSERNAGLEELENKILARSNSAIAGNEQEGSGFNKLHEMKNHHPTVKPIKLMEYLCKLITPPNGTVLDPFMGSGTTGIAATNLNYNFVGIEREEEYYSICVNRIKNAIEKAKSDFEANQ